MHIHENFETTHYHMSQSHGDIDEMVPIQHPIPKFLVFNSHPGVNYLTVHLYDHVYACSDVYKCAVVEKTKLLNTFSSLVFDKLRLLYCFEV